MKKERAWRLRVLRAAQEPRLTQSELARRVAARLGRSFSMQRYWQIENGEGASPSNDEQQAVAAALGVKVSDIDWPDTMRQATA